MTVSPPGEGSVVWTERPNPTGSDTCSSFVRVEQVVGGRQGAAQSDDRDLNGRLPDPHEHEDSRKQHQVAGQPVYVSATITLHLRGFLDYLNVVATISAPVIASTKTTSSWWISSGLEAISLLVRPSPPRR